MRTLLALIAFALGCIGCGQTVTSTVETPRVLPAGELSDRPSFYSKSNLAEYYGRCPKCQQWVKGYISSITYTDASGKLGCMTTVMGTCEHCSQLLFADDWVTDPSRIVRWAAQK